MIVCTTEEACASKSRSNIDIEGSHEHNSFHSRVLTSVTGFRASDGEAVSDALGAGGVPQIGEVEVERPIVDLIGRVGPRIEVGGAKALRCLTRGLSPLLGPYHQNRSCTEHSDCAQ